MLNITRYLFLLIGAINIGMLVSVQLDLNIPRTILLIMAIGSTIAALAPWDKQ